MLNVVAIMGRLVRDPELNTTKSGVNVCRFRIACDRSFVRQGEERQADFIDILAWRQQADFVCKYFSKGSLIAVEGSLQTETYQAKDGTTRTRTEVVANNVNFAGPKGTDKPAVQSFDQQTASHVREANAAQNPPQPAPGYSQGSADDFAVISDDDDLPF